MVFDALPRGIPIRGAFENGGQRELRREQGGWRNVCYPVGAVEDFTGRSISLPRSASRAFPPMTSSSVTADTRSEQFLAKHDARGWVRTVGRFGMASRGVIYLLLAYLAFDVARHGSAPAQTSSTGALQELEARTDGKLLLVVLAIGLGCYAAWRLFDVVTGANGAMRRVSSLAVGIIYGVLCVRAVELVVGHSVSGGASSNPEPWVAKVMGWSGGAAAIEVAGAGLVAAGVGLAAWGLLHRYDRNLALSACRVRGKRGSGFWVALEIWPEGPSSSSSVSISSQQR